MKLLISSFLIISFFIGCGYKPSSYYAKNAITGNVYVELKVDINNAKNSVYVKDAMNDMVLNQFKASLTNDKSTADTLVTLGLSSVSNIALSTDSNGYTNSYRTRVNILVTYQKRDEEIRSLSVSDYYDYAVDTDSSITDLKKNTAVKFAATKALSSLFSKIAINTMKE